MTKLTLEQELFIEKLKRTAPLMSKEELSKYLVEAMIQNLHNQNLLEKISESRSKN